MSVLDLRSSLIVSALAVSVWQSPGLVPQQLNVDTAQDPTVQRCLADAKGVVARYTDDEPFVAADPTRPDRAVAIWQTRSGTGSVIQWSHSTDRGRRWSAPRAVPINACAGGPIPSALRSSDPWVTIGPDGRWYLSAIAFMPGPDNGPDVVNALIVVTSSDAGATWQRPVAIAVAPSAAFSHDNLAVTADPSRPGVAYAATTLAERPGAGTYFGRLGLTRTRDGGRTWDPIRPVTPAVNGERIGAPQIVVDKRSGQLFAVYHARVGGASRIGVRASSDQGTTWGPETAAAVHVRAAGVQHPRGGARFVLAEDILGAAISPRDGRLLIAYADAHRTEGQHNDISMIWSADGRTWSAPIAVSDPSERTAWLPAIAVNADGDVAVAYQSADFSGAGPGAGQVRVLLRRFTPGESGYRRSGLSVLDQSALAWPGHYQGLTALGQGFLAVYGRGTDIWSAYSR